LSSNSPYRFPALTPFQKQGARAFAKLVFHFARAPQSHGNRRLVVHQVGTSNLAAATKKPGICGLAVMLMASRGA
jgi:hypothetical protein